PQRHAVHARTSAGDAAAARDAAAGGGAGAGSGLRNLRRAGYRADGRPGIPDALLLLGEVPPRLSDEARAMTTRAPAEQTLREQIVEIGRRLYARGYTASNDGNISVRLDERRLLMTPKSVCKGFMSADMMCITDLDGRKLAGERDPSSEMQM